MEGPSDEDISNFVESADMSMAAFIEQHMANILQPFADHVGELHRGVELLTADLNQTTQLARENKSSSAVHADLLVDIRKDLDAAANSAVVMSTEIATTNKRLEEDIMQMLSTTQKVEQHERAVAANEKDVGELRQQLVDLSGHVTCLESGVTEIKNEVADVLQPPITRLQSEVARLDAVNTRIVQELQTTKDFVSQLDAELQKSKAAAEQFRRRDEKTLLHLNEKLVDLANGLKDLNHRSQTNAEHLKTTNQQLRPLKIRVDEADELQKALRREHVEAEAAFQQLRDSFNAQKGAFDEMLSKFSGMDIDGSNIFDKLGKVHEFVTRQSFSLSNLDEFVHQLNDTVVQNLQRSKSNEMFLAGHAQRIQACEDRIGIAEEREQRLERSVTEARMSITRSLSLSSCSPMARSSAPDTPSHLAQATEVNLHEFSSNFKRSISPAPISTACDVTPVQSRQDKVVLPVVHRKPSVSAPPPVQEEEEELLGTNATDHFSNISTKADVPLSVKRREEQWSISEGQQAMMAQVDQNVVELKKTSSHLKSTSAKLEQTIRRVAAVESGMLAVNDNIVRLDVGLELNKEYWVGLSKGFRATEKSFAGDLRGNSLAVTLPALASSSKSPRCDTSMSTQCPSSMSNR